jgi:hypothetical protein
MNAKMLNIYPESILLEGFTLPNGRVDRVGKHLVKP